MTYNKLVIVVDAVPVSDDSRYSPKGTVEASISFIALLLCLAREHHRISSKSVQIVKHTHASKSQSRHCVGIAVVANAYEQARRNVAKCWKKFEVRA